MPKLQSSSSERVTWCGREMRPLMVDFSGPCSCGSKKRFDANPRALVFRDHPEGSSPSVSLSKEKSPARKLVSAKSNDANLSGNKVVPALLLLVLELLLDAT